MNFTNHQIRGLYYLFGTLFLLSCYHYTIGYLTLSEIIEKNDPNDGTISLRSLVGNILYSAAFWLPVGYALKNKKAALITLAFSAVVIIIRNVLNTSFSFSSEYTLLYHIYIYGTQMLTYGLFGWLVLKNKKWITFLFIALISIGFSNVYQSHYIYEFLSLFGADVFDVKFNKTSSSYSTLNFISFSVRYSIVLLSYLVTIGLYNRSQSKKVSFYQFLQTDLPSPSSKIQFSLVYWILRVALFVLAFTAIKFSYLIEREVYSLLLIRMTLPFIAIYVVGSLYRNWLTSYLLARNENIGWLYLGLNVPIINFFCWLYLIFKKPVPNQISPTEFAQKEQKQQSIHRNSAIQAITYAYLGGLIVFQFFTRTSYPIIGGYMLSILFAMLYFNSSKAYHPLYFFIVTCSIIANFVSPNQRILEAITYSGLINLVIIYSLFHLDQLEFKSTEEKQIA